jgi:membrane protease YdiL (CAAX protease family)
VEGSSEEDAQQAIARRRLGPTLAPVLIVALLGVVTVVSAGRRSGAGAHGHGPGKSFYDYLFSSLMIAWGLFGLLLLYLFLRERQVKRKERKAWEFRGLRLIVFLLGFVLLGLIFHAPLQRLRERFAFNPPAKKPGGGPGTLSGAHSSQVHELEFRWAPLIATVMIALIVLAAFVASVMRRRALEALEARTIEEALAQVMDDALDDIRAERDPRKAIIAAYARMEKLLAGFGRPRAPAEAPFEYLSRVLLELRVSRHPVEALTELFERAKFSVHSLGGEDKSRAIEALESVRDELRDPVAVAAEQAPAPA